ncbi:hypothetical protein CBR_g32620 [Chara braunii]|uniref:Uncharacterized protein n=1 Tax=Chara braunii TaxID=69332 RepID=A0A388LH79_CHABU|nr:hypothetical protein CBR_g32620 [Chara braunii]|eukprot:GBG81627.1 hypothetical protein CBR_g32620 [Chara braunii]
MPAFYLKGSGGCVVKERGEARGLRGRTSLGAMAAAMTAMAAGGTFMTLPSVGGGSDERARELVRESGSGSGSGCGSMASTSDSRASVLSRRSRQLALTCQRTVSWFVMSELHRLAGTVWETLRKGIAICQRECEMRLLLDRASDRDRDPDRRWRRQRRLSSYGRDLSSAATWALIPEDAGSSSSSASSSSSSSFARWIWRRQWLQAMGRKRERDVASWKPWRGACRNTDDCGSRRSPSPRGDVGISDARGEVMGMGIGLGSGREKKLILDVEVGDPDNHQTNQREAGSRLSSADAAEAGIIGICDIDMVQHSAESMLRESGTPMHYFDGRFDYAVVHPFERERVYLCSQERQLEIVDSTLLNAARGTAMGLAVLIAIIWHLPSKEDSIAANSLPLVRDTAVVRSQRVAPKRRKVQAGSDRHMREPSAKLWTDEEQVMKECLLGSRSFPSLSTTASLGIEQDHTQKAVAVRAVLLNATDCYPSHVSATVFF